MVEHDEAGVHITVTLLTDVYTVHGPTPSNKFGWLNRMIVNDAVAHYVSHNQHRVPSLTAVKEACSLSR